MAAAEVTRPPARIRAVGAADLVIFSAREEVEQRAVVLEEQRAVALEELRKTSKEVLGYLDTAGTGSPDGVCRGVSPSVSQPPALLGGVGARDVSIRHCYC